MLDVFVVAILVVTVKLGAIASITVHFGIYLFTLAVLASMLLTHKIAAGPVRAANKREGYRREMTGACQVNA